MNTQLRIALVGLVIGLAVPTFAQEQKTVDPHGATNLSYFKRMS